MARGAKASSNHKGVIGLHPCISSFAGSNVQTLNKTFGAGRDAWREGGKAYAYSPLLWPIAYYAKGLGIRVRVGITRDSVREPGALEKAYKMIKGSNESGLTLYSAIEAAVERVPAGSMELLKAVMLSVAVADETHTILRLWTLLQAVSKKTGGVKPVNLRRLGQYAMTLSETSITVPGTLLLLKMVGTLGAVDEKNHTVGLKPHALNEVEEELIRTIMSVPGFEEVVEMFVKVDEPSEHPEFYQDVGPSGKSACAMITELLNS